MQQVSFVLVFVVLSTAEVLIQDPSSQQMGEIRSENIDGWKRYPLNNYMTNKRAINGQLRRSSILWGKRSQEWKGYHEMEEMPIWSQNNNKNYENKEIVTPELDEDNKVTKFVQRSTDMRDNTKMEREAKDGIRPKLALSSRLWGRR